MRSIVAFLTILTLMFVCCGSVSARHVHKHVHHVKSKTVVTSGGSAGAVQTKVSTRHRVKTSACN